MYRVKYSTRQGSWYIEATEGSDDFGTSLYDTEQEAYDDLARMVVEGLIKQEEIDTTRASWVDEREQHILRVMRHGSSRAEAEAAVDSLKPWPGAFVEGQDGR